MQLDDLSAYPEIWFPTFDALVGLRATRRKRLLSGQNGIRNEKRPSLLVRASFVGETVAVAMPTRRRHVTRMSNSNRFAVSASWMVPASHRTKCRPKP
jgi:hypothetical protein